MVSRPRVVPWSYLLFGVGLPLLVDAPPARADAEKLDNTARSYESRIQKTRQRIRSDFRSTERLFGLKPSSDSRIFKAQVVRDLDDSLEAIEKKVRSARRRGKLHSTRVELGGGLEVKVLSSRSRPRIGFFGVSADPLTQGHVALALRAVARGELDHVVLLPTGRGNQHKSHLGLNEALRHTLAKRALGEFPCLSYSPIARGTRQDGETSFSRLIDLNGAGFEPVYIVGGDHNHYFKKGAPDTLGKIAQARDKGLLPPDVSVMLFERPGYAFASSKPPAGVNPVAVEHLPPTRFESSSSTLRGALAGVAKGPQLELMLMPWRSARTLGRLVGGTSTALPKSGRAPRRSYNPARKMLPLRAR